MCRNSSIIFTRARLRDPMIEHKLSIVMETCQWLSVLDDGEIIAEGIPPRWRRTQLLSKRIWEPEMSAVLSVEDLSTRHGGGFEARECFAECSGGRARLHPWRERRRQDFAPQHNRRDLSPMLGHIRFLGREIGGMPSHNVAKGGLALAPQTIPSSSC